MSQYCLYKRAGFAEFPDLIDTCSVDPDTMLRLNPPRLGRGLSNARLPSLIPRTDQPGDSAVLVFNNSSPLRSSENLLGIEGLKPPKRGMDQASVDGGIADSSIVAREPECIEKTGQLNQEPDRMTWSVARVSSALRRNAADVR